MKKIKRTITIRKIEFTASGSPNHDENSEVCPLCNCPIHAVKSAINSTVEHTAVESSIKLIEEIANESSEETKD